MCVWKRDKVLYTEVRLEQLKVSKEIFIPLNYNGATKENLQHGSCGYRSILTVSRILWLDLIEENQKSLSRRFLETVFLEKKNRILGSVPRG